MIFKWMNKQPRILKFWNFTIIIKMSMSMNNLQNIEPSGNGLF